MEERVCCVDGGCSSGSEGRRQLVSFHPQSGGREREDGPCSLGLPLFIQSRAPMCFPHPNPKSSLEP